MDIRRILIIFVVAVLFGIFTFSAIDAAYPAPDYEDFCREEGLLRNPGPTPIYQKQVPVEHQCPAYDDSARQKCIVETKGEPMDTYDNYGCPSYKGCSLCNQKLQAVQNIHNFWAFIISSILGLIAVMCGIYLPRETNPMHEWIGTGFMLGGLGDIFFGTAQYFSELHRIWRPIVILLELMLVIFVAYKYLAPALFKEKGMTQKTGKRK
ncbi:MAG: hypothetical protein AABX47_09050 [Nanoarchaeota archaeon]